VEKNLKKTDFGVKNAPQCGRFIRTGHEEPDSGRLGVSVCTTNSHDSHDVFTSARRFLATRTFNLELLMRISSALFLLLLVVTSPLAVGCGGKLSEEEAAKQSAGENDLGPGDDGEAPAEEMPAKEE
jgi:hypothetical protein